ncbi:hypothetical protein KJ641_00820 [Patescibacteria group bacterium]|nr:hypothetical protein [Patescibacteria group bacterium]
MKLTQNNFEKVSSFIKTNARDLDKQLYAFYFEGDSADKVFTELANYQNDDGGFGRGIEPDFVTSSSSVIATTIAIQYMEKLETTETNETLKNTIDYFVNSFSEEHQKWSPVPIDVNNSPHAPWWHIDEKSGMCVIDQSWENPTVEILGYLHKYPNSFPALKLEELTRRAVEGLQSDEDIPEHSLYCYQIFYTSLSEQLKAQIKPRLFERIKAIVNTNVDEWREKYVPKPLNFVDGPESPFYNLLRDSVHQNLDFLIETIDANEAWFPTWSWGQYEKEWVKARIEWAGKIAVENLVVLKKFSKINNQ